MSLSPAKSSRRALLDKSTNALLTPSKPHGAEYSSKASRDAQLLSPPAVAGHKRSIDQVETDQLAPRSASSSFSNVRREDEFYIPENTQSSIGEENKENAFPEVAEPLEQSTVPNQVVDHNLSSQRRDALSSLLNLSFNSDNNSSPKQQLTPQIRRSPSIVPTEPAARKAFIQNKASLLRHRLQTAMKSIKGNNQIDRRLSDLEALTRERSFDSHQPRNTEFFSVDETTPRPKVPKLLPAADLRPSSASARRDTVPLSSPPVSTTDETRDRDVPSDNTTTPKQTMPNNEPTTPDFQIHQLSSPPRTGEGSIVIDRHANCSVEKNIARAKQGQAVDGLLKLMQTTSEYDSLDTWTG